MSSHEFDDAFTHAASDKVLCEHCGTTHFTRHAEDFDELLIQSRSMTTGKYLYESMDDSIAWGFVGGKQYVYQCPCKSADRYENWVWEHREEIIKYLKARTKKESEEAARNLESANSI